MDAIPGGILRSEKFGTGTGGGGMNSGALLAGGGMNAGDPSCFDGGSFGVEFTF